MGAKNSLKKCDIDDDEIISNDASFSPFLGLTLTDKFNFLSFLQENYTLSKRERNSTNFRSSGCVVARVENEDLFIFAFCGFHDRGMTQVHYMEEGKIVTFREQENTLLLKKDEDDKDENEEEGEEGEIGEEDDKVLFERCEYMVDFGIGSICMDKKDDDSVIICDYFQKRIVFMSISKKFEVTREIINVTEKPKGMQRLVRVSDLGDGRYFCMSDKLYYKCAVFDDESKGFSYFKNEKRKIKDEKWRMELEELKKFTNIDYLPLKSDEDIIVLASFPTNRHYYQNFDSEKIVISFLDISNMRRFRRVEIKNPNKMRVIQKLFGGFPGGKPYPIYEYSFLNFLGSYLTKRGNERIICCSHPCFVRHEEKYFSYLFVLDTLGFVLRNICLDYREKISSLVEVDNGMFILYGTQSFFTLDMKNGRGKKVKKIFNFERNYGNKSRWLLLKMGDNVVNNLIWVEKYKLILNYNKSLDVRGLIFDSDKWDRSSFVVENTDSFVIDLKGKRVRGSKAFLIS